MQRIRFVCPCNAGGRPAQFFKSSFVFVVGDFPWLARDCQSESNEHRTGSRRYRKKVCCGGGADRLLTQLPVDDCRSFHAQQTRTDSDMYIVAPRQVHQPSELNPADTAPTPPRSRSIGMHVPPVLWLCVGQESSPLRETPPQEHGGRQRSPKRVPQRGVRRSRCRCRHNCDHHRDVEPLSILLYLIRRDTRRYTCLKQFATPLLVKPGYVSVSSV